tara:strand:+ start:48839 stop:49819 length:981 start_codon:yes stop_codon:yes gene_type:complete
MEDRMETRQLGQLWPVSALSLGGGGIGQLWGKTTRDECIATVQKAIDLGITLLDMAPSYGNGEAELVVGAAFDGNLPAGVRVSTKHRLGETNPDKIEQDIRRGLTESLKRLRLEKVDLFFLHSNIIPHDFDASVYVTRPATRWHVYKEHFIPTCKKLVAEGKIGAWSITGIGVPECLLAALELDDKPAAVQCITNLLDSPGDLKYFPGPSRAREIIKKTKSVGAGVLGIRPVQGGALTDAIDRELPAEHGVVTDYVLAADYRLLAKKLGTTPAALAHRYALAMEGVDTVVLGCKNTTELQECVAAAAQGPLEPEIIAQIDASISHT